MGNVIPLETLLRQVQDLPALPEVAAKVMRMIDDPKVSSADVGKTISADPALTARVLKLANSAFYGATRRISTVTEAVVMLGMKTVRNMAMAVSCRDLLQNALPGYALRQGDLWRSSLCCAYAAQSLARRAKYHVVEEAFVGGLLHDVGKVVMSLYLQQQFAQILQRALGEHIPFTDAEREALGFDHAEAGARVLDKWNLPDVLVDCVRYHHNPLAQTPLSPLTCLVHVADIVCVTLGVGLGGDGLNYPFQSEVLERLKLSEADFEETLSEVSGMASQIDTLF